MCRDRWGIFGVIGAALACLACLTPAPVPVLGAIGLGTVTGRLDLVGLPLPMGFAGLAVYRYGRLWQLAEAVNKIGLRAALKAGAAPK